MIEAQTMELEVLWQDLSLGPFFLFGLSFLSGTMKEKQQ